MGGKATIGLQEGEEEGQRDISLFESAPRIALKTSLQEYFKFTVSAEYRKLTAAPIRNDSCSLDNEGGSDKKRNDSIGILKLCFGFHGEKL